ncbi:MAG: tail fiber domain-containing protein, partial [Bacteroidota bacterium]
ATGSRGGFAVGGFNPSKSSTNDYLWVTPDSVRIYIEEGSGSKASGNRGGFAVGGFSPSKAFTNEFLRVTDDSSRVWTYGDGGFGILDLETGSLNYLNLTPNNYFIGHESGDSISTGLYNSFFGYQTGKSNDVADDNVFIGYKSGLLNKNGGQNVFIGKETGSHNISGYSNCFIGHLAGFNNEDGYRNLFLGQEAGFSNIDGIYNVLLGYKAGYANTSGSHNAFIGYQSGVSNISGWTNVFVGSYTGYDNTTGTENVFLGCSSGVNNATGVRNTYIGFSSGLNCNNSDNVFVGYKAGFNEANGNRLYIENTDAGSTQALIYGEFDNNKLRVNNFLGVGRMPAVNQLEVQGDASKTTAGLWAANSDRRIKTDIQDIDNSFETIMKLHPVIFKYTDEWRERNPSIKDQYYYNFIAQEFKQVFPNSVKGSGEFITNDNEEILQIDTYNAYVVSIKAIQDLINENRSLKKEIKDISLRLKDIESVINASVQK